MSKEYENFQNVLEKVLRVGKTLVELDISLENDGKFEGFKTDNDTYWRVINNDGLITVRMEESNQYYDHDFLPEDIEAIIADEDEWLKEEMRLMRGPYDDPDWDE